MGADIQMQPCATEPYDQFADEAPDGLLINDDLMGT